MISVKQVHPESVFPTKAHPSDVGYDLTIVNEEPVKYGKAFLYNTGIAVKPEDGYYIEIVPRSSFSKLGYSFANCVGIIDPDYRGTLKIAINWTEIEHGHIFYPRDHPLEHLLPCKAFQMIVRKLEKSSLIKVEDLDDTVRGEGGFGSSG